MHNYAQKIHFFNLKSNLILASLNASSYLARHKKDVLEKILSLDSISQQQRCADGNNTISLVFSKRWPG